MLKRGSTCKYKVIAAVSTLKYLTRLVFTQKSLYTDYLTRRARIRPGYGI
jgi:hypothetical protein